MTKYFFLLFSINLFGQNHLTTDNYGTWFGYLGTHKFAEKWSLLAEIQLRQTEGISTPNQLLIRPGLQYHLSPQLTIAAGYAYANTHPYGEFPVLAEFPEHRLWEQIQIKNQVDKTEWLARLRQEQRYSYLPISDGIGGFKAADTATFTNRIRLNNKFSIPFKGNKIEDKSLYWFVADEIFLNFGKNVRMNIFDQNRFQLGLGYKMPKYGKLELGYMIQTFQRPDGVRIQHDHNLVLVWHCGLGLN